ncbi:GntR family transcriptional regulator [Neobacillus massiliamazoniensis]|uniref:GntR family transcriptional regulator n=1 Tax=Neobacillus massiliamazoniensis TaxID=1499688 RepID=A0A0U1P489_9BACI|nr:GntR family transcriptional regulator [Neobacillus massiliamazoniensis]CRK85105.1 GntR family transcriptional regulator [Neobacillus massiliamazoniensis]
MGNVSEEKSTVVNYVTKSLRKAILNGTLKKGERLIQEEWAERLEVSRMPIREALTQLQMEGLVEMVPHKGAIVTPITRDNIEEIYQTRALLEGLAVEKSLPFLKEVDKNHLKDILIKMEKLEISDATNDQYIQLNAAFHETLRKGCPWQRVQKMVETLGISPIAPNLLVNHYPETQREHRMIYEAALRGDPKELRAAVEYHILRTKNNLIQYMEEINNKLS